MNNTSPSKMKHSSSSISNLMKGLDVVVMLFEQVKCEVIENASQAASHGRYRSLSGKFGGCFLAGNLPPMKRNDVEF